MRIKPVEVKLYKEKSDGMGGITKMYNYTINTYGYLVEKEKFTIVNSVYNSNIIVKTYFKILKLDIKLDRPDLIEICYLEQTYKVISAKTNNRFNILEIITKE